MRLPPDVLTWHFPAAQTVPLTHSDVSVQAWPSFARQTRLMQFPETHWVEEEQG